MPKAVQVSVGSHGPIEFDSVTISPDGTVSLVYRKGQSPHVTASDRIEILQEGENVVIRLDPDDPTPAWVYPRDSN